MSIQDFKSSYTQQQSARNLEKATNLQDANLDSDEKIEEAAREFEKMMVKMMFIAVEASILST